MNMLKLGQEVANMLGEGYHVAPHTLPHDAFVIIRNDQKDPSFGIKLRHESLNKKIRISGTWPAATDYTEYPYDKDKPSPSHIYVGEARKPVDITKEIHNRFLPIYSEAHKWGVELRNMHNTYLAKQQKNLEELADLLHGNIRGEMVDGGPAISTHGYISKLQVGADTTTLEFHNLSMEATKRILTAYLDGWVGDCYQCRQPLDKKGRCQSEGCKLFGKIVTVELKKRK